MFSRSSACHHKPGNPGQHIQPRDSALDPFVLAFFGGDDLTQSLFTQTTRGPNAPDRFVGFEDPALGLTLPQNAWTSFVMQFASIGSSSTYQLYLNGTLARQISFNYFLRVEYDQPMPVQIGALTGYTDSQFRGEIDDVRFYNRALNLDEIAALNVPGNPSNVPESSGNAGAGIQIAVLKLGGEAATASESSHVSRIQFSIPIIPPVTTVKEMPA